MVGPDDVLCGFIGEKVTQARPPISPPRNLIHMTRIMAVFSGSGQRLLGIDSLKMWSGRAQFLAIDDQASIIPDADVLIPQGDQPFNVELSPVLGPHPFNMIGFEDNDLPPLWPPEVVAKSVHKQMVTAVGFQANNVVSFFVNLAGIFQLRPAPK